MSPVTDKYFLLLFEYLHIMNTSEIAKGADNADHLVQIGWSAITHIYKLGFCILHRIDEAGTHAQKAMYCYLEYIEQISKQSNSTSSVDALEAVVFIYDKILGPITDQHVSASASGRPITDQHVSASASGRPITEASASGRQITDQHVAASASGRQITDASGRQVVAAMSGSRMIEKLHALSNLLLWFGNVKLATSDRVYIAETEFYKYAHYYIDNDGAYLDHLFAFLEVFKDLSASMTRDEWISVLHVFLKHTKRAIKTKTAFTRETVAEKCMFTKTQVFVGMNEYQIDECVRAFFQE